MSRDQNQLKGSNRTGSIVAICALLMAQASVARAESEEGSLDLGFLIRPFFSGSGVGTVADGWLAYRFATLPVEIRGDSGPAALSWGNPNGSGPTFFYWVPSSLTASYVSRWVAIGAGVTAVYGVVRCTAQGCPGASTLGAAEALRLGPEDRFYLEWRSALTMVQGHVSLQFFKAELHVSLGPGGGLFLQVGSGNGSDNSSWGFLLLGGDFRIGGPDSASLALGVGLCYTEVLVFGGFDGVGWPLYGFALGGGLRWR